MSIHKFYHRCDKCGTRGEEYSAFPSCRECFEDVCLACSTDHDPETGRATCHQCAAEDALLAAAHAQGRKCGLMGSAFALNPFPHGTDQHEEWIKGWNSAQVEQLQRYGRGHAARPC